MPRSVSKILSLICLAIGALFGKVSAQYDPFYAHHFNNQLVLNPAFTGFRNALAVDLSVRRQWLGIAGAPKSYFVTAHTPINDTKLSVGGHMQSWTAGPVSYRQFSLDYSYLARLGDRMFLSLGMDAGYMGQSVGFSDLVLVDGSDPNFEKPLEKKNLPTVGVGAVLFTPILYVGFSRPTISLFSLSDNGKSLHPVGQYYSMAGVSLPEFKKVSTKISTFGRITDNGFTVLDVTARFFYNDLIGSGITIRPNHSWSVLLDVQVNRNVSLTYSYDIPLSNSPFVSYGSHEVTLSYDIYKFYKRNKYRTFKRKKEIDESKIRSIRYF